MTYSDTNVINETNYQYYVTALYGVNESDSSNTVAAYPTAATVFEGIIGTGTSSNGTTAACPINVYYESLHGQSVYTAAELNAVGIYGSIDITQIGFNVTGLPTKAMPSYIIRMGHTSATDVTSWIATGLTTHWTSTSYQPTATGWNMFTLATPFTWNGTDNIVIDTAFGDIGSWEQTGTTQYTSLTAGYRYVRDDYTDQTSVFTGGSSSTNRPNLKVVAALQATNPEIVVTPTSLDFGAVEVYQSSVLQFTVQNTGTAPLTGSVSTPGGYSVAELSAKSFLSSGEKNIQELRSTQTEIRNTLSFSIPAGLTKTYNLTFAPTIAASYNVNLVITSNDYETPTVNIALTGNGYIPPTISLDGNSLEASLAINGEGADSFTLSNSGTQNLSYTLVENPAVGWFGAVPVSGTVSGGGNQLITGSFSTDGLAPGTYSSTLLVNSNDPDNPQLSVSVELTVTNTLPTIDLPENLAFDMYANLVEDFTAYVSDLDGQTLILGYSGNTNILVSIDGFTVTFTAVENWHGSEAITFSVFDGYEYAYDTVTVTVNLSHLAVPDVAVAKSAGGVTVSWNAVANANRYYIYRATEPYGNYGSVPFAIVYAPSTIWEDTQALPMAFYRVIAAFEELPAKTK